MAILNQLRFLLFICLAVPVARGQGTVSRGSDLLQFEYDAADGHKVKIRWNPDADSSRVREILYREVFGESVGSDRKYGSWQWLKKHPIPRNMSFFFKKPELCLTYEFKIVINNSRNEPLITNLTLPMPPIAWSRGHGVLKLDRIVKQNDGYIYASVSFVPRFDFWTEQSGAKISNIAIRLKPDGCRTIFSASSQPNQMPQIINNGREVKFDEFYARHGCKFSYLFDAELTVPGERSCGSHSFSLGEDLALEISLECEGIDEYPCPVRDTSQCYDCKPVRTNATPTVVYRDGKQQSVLNISWAFDTPYRPSYSNTPDRYEVRWGVGNLSSLNVFTGERLGGNGDRQIQKVPYMLVELLSNNDNRITQVYTLQVCALYDPILLDTRCNVDLCDAPVNDQWSCRDKYMLNSPSDYKPLIDRSIDIDKKQSDSVDVVPGLLIASSTDEGSGSVTATLSTMFVVFSVFSWCL